MPIWVDGCCVMRSLITEPGICGDPNKINALSRELGNPGWTEKIPCINYNHFMGDLDNNQFQPNIHDFANNTVVPSGADREVNHENNNRSCITKNHEWTDQQKHRIVEIDTHERRRRKNFMKRIKARWDGEFPDSKRTAQNLIDNAKRFMKDRWETN